MQTPIRSVLCLAAAAALLSGCQDARRALGLDKSVPDEFAVVSRAPLVMPPDYNLQPPAPGAARPQEGSTAEQARAVLVGRNKINAYRARGFSPGEVTLLDKAGAETISPDIRRIVDRETSVFAAEERSFTDRLVFWRSEGATGTPIDPVAEQKRLNENQALGKSPSEGPIPVITRGGRKVLGIF